VNFIQNRNNVIEKKTKSAKIRLKKKIQRLECTGPVSFRAGRQYRKQKRRLRLEAGRTDRLSKFEEWAFRSETKIPERSVSEMMPGAVSEDTI